MGSVKLNGQCEIKWAVVLRVVDSGIGVMNGMEVMLKSE
jgi:hypothetical protein